MFYSIAVMETNTRIFIEIFPGKHDTKKIKELETKVINHWQILICDRLIMLIEIVQQFCKFPIIT
jgi:hypothetical protein